MNILFASIFLLAFSIVTISAAPVDAVGNPPTSKYMVKLRSVKTMDTLFKLDDMMKTQHHLRDCIKKKFSFGDFEGFSGDFTAEVIEQLKSNPLVAEVTPDVIVRASEVEVEKDAPRHLVRLSQHDRIEEGQEMDYYYDEDFQGQGVNAYVLDTGVLISHPQFEGRLHFGADLTQNGGKGEDVQGHGTHVAGVIGSEMFGVAKKIEIISVKVLDDTGTGTLSSVIEGLEFAVNHMRESRKPGVGNLSLGALKNSVLNDAIRGLYNAGLVMVVAAGNSNADACGDSPLSSPYAITVGAIDDRTDRIATFSNWGECVNVFASGVYVESLYNWNLESSILMSGTSMSSPTVAGFAGVLLSQGIRPENIASELYELSLDDAIPDIDIYTREGTPNRLVYNDVTH